MIVSHKIALAPNNRQATYFARACGVARFAYNWALAQWQVEYKAGGKPSQQSLRKKLNAIKKESFPWMQEVTKCAPQQAIMHLGDAFKNFFAGRAKYPVFKKKGVRDSFKIDNTQFSVSGSHIRIPKLGLVRMCEALRFAGKIMSATISRTADKWHVSIAVEIETPKKAVSENQRAVGVDLGVKSLAVLSTGEAIEGAKPHKALLGRLRRLSRSLSRKQKGSSNRNKAKKKLARLHAKIADIRNDALHKLTTRLTRDFGVIGIEDLNVRGMAKNRCLSRSVMDMGFFEFRRQLMYKAEKQGCTVVVANRFYPSSKTCSGCGHKLESLSLGVRSWTCGQCGCAHDRDVNAAINLRNMAVSSTVSACGEEGSGSGLVTRLKPASGKQEFSVKDTFR